MMLRSALILPLAAGCVINSDKWPRPRDLSESWLVDRTRLLAIRADPPEIRPGESSTFAALMPVPGGEDLVRVWFACPVIEGALGCSPDLSGLDLDTMDPSALVELGLIGVEPGFTPSYRAPLDLLADVSSEQELREGRTVVVQVSGLPEDGLGASEDLDFNALEVGFKRLVVSEATTPNHNPEIVAFEVDGIAVRSHQVVHLEPNQSYDLATVLDDASIETYDYLNSEGILEQRTEEPFVAWYATDGEVVESYTLYPYNEASWISPGRGAEGAWYAVVRDRRGGMAWWTQEWVVD